jgi:hypothetical protein
LQQNGVDASNVRQNALETYLINDSGNFFLPDIFSERSIVKYSIVVLIKKVVISLNRLF